METTKPQELFQDVSEAGGSKGILPSQDIRQLIRAGRISAIQEISPDQVQPASIDLRLGREAFRVRASFLPGRSSTLVTKATAGDLLVARVELTEQTHTLLEPGKVYVIPLMESLALPSDVLGIANPKSTTGRLDIFTRLLTECGEEFERVPRGYSGKLYVEIVSRTFPIRIRAGMKLNQLRFLRGSQAPTGDGALREARADLLVQDGDNGSSQAPVNRGWLITVDLQGSGDTAIVAYKAKKYTPPIELDRIGYYDVADFWEAIPRPKFGRMILEPDGFYLLASKRPVRVPSDRAAEMMPYDPAMGEFRVHYAGFFDPGFGYGSQGEIPGTKAVLEVRAHEIPFLLEDDQLVGRLNYYKMAGIPEKVYGVSIGSSYQQQGLALSKQFKKPA